MAVQGSTRCQAISAGMLFGVAAYGPMLFWLVASAGYVAWVLLILVQGAWLAATAVLLRRWVADRWVVLALPILWAGTDALRGAVPWGGFEWGAISYAHVDGSWLLPIARLAGDRAITVVVALASAFLFDAWRRIEPSLRDLDGTGTERVTAALPQAQRSLVGLVAVLAVSGLATIEPPATTGSTLSVLAVQGNDRDDPTTTNELEDRLIAERQLDLTLAAVADGADPDLTVWPESSVDRDPYSPSGADLAPVVEQAAAATGGHLLFGANIDGPEPRENYYNTAVLVDRDGQVVDRYRKRNLVPFGEFVPFRSALDWFPPLRQVPRDGLRGERAQSLAVGSATVAVVICFETMFSRTVRSNILAGDQPAGLLVASTNDASFGRSSEADQHIAQSRMRSVETGRWTVHAALSGRSAIIDPEGRVQDITDHFTAETLAMEIPLVAGRTPFLVIGDVLGTALRLLWLGFVGAGLVRLARRRRTGGG